jgi:hypothetical protein
LDVHEQQLATLRDQQAELQKKQTAFSEQLDQLMENLAF